MQLSPVSSSVYDVTLTGVAGDGTLGLKLVDNESIQDTAGNQLASLSSKISFRTQSQLPAGQVSVPVEVSDLNRDGWQDVVAANHDDGVVGIFLGLGDGTFLNQMTFPAGNNPIALAIGDLNGDGIPDLVVTNESDAVASVLIGNGDGTFQTRQTYSTGSAPFDVALGDVNNDGKLDAVTVNINDTASVSILLGNGDGTFQSQRQLGYGTGSTSIKLSDLNADNNLDLLITNLHTDQLLVIHGNGDSTFRTAQTFAVGVDPWSSGLGDINNDGRLDIAVSNNNGHTLSLLLGNGEGAFQAHQTLPTGVSPTSVYIADLNGDRIPDLLNDNFNSNSVSVFRGNGNGTFQSVQSFPIGINPRVMVLSDFNDDGRPDLVTANQASGNLSILINNSRGDFVGQVYNIGIQLLTPSPSTQALRPTFTWTPAVGATSYELQISNDSTGAARYHMSTVTGTSYSPPTDLAIGRFRIWIRPTFGATRGNWTPAYNFSILAPVAWKPVNRIQLTSQPTLEWQTLPGAVKYDLWIDNVSTGQKQVVRQELTTTAWTPSADLPMGIYRAWIRGIDARGTLANWSPFLEFVVVPGPIPIGPMNGTFDRTPAFAWSSVAGASSYELYLKNLNTQAMVINGLSMTATSYSPPTNLVDGLYRWWVVAVSPPGTGSLRSGASNPANIYVGGRPSITTPAQGSTTADRTPLFAWTGIEGAATYRLQVDRINVPQSGIILQTGLTGTTFTPVTDLPAGTFRAWIRAVSVGGELSPWSLEVNFTVT